MNQIKNANYIYQSVSIVMIIVMIILLFITKNYPTYPLVQGILVGWAMQYVAVNFIVLIAKKNFIN